MRTYLSLWRGVQTWIPAETWQEVVDEIRGMHAVTRRELMSQSRTARIVRCRHQIMYELRQRGNSFPWIAARLGLRNHTSVWHGCRRHAERLAAFAYSAEADSL